MVKAYQGASPVGWFDAGPRASHTGTEDTAQYSYGRPAVGNFLDNGGHPESTIPSCAIEPSLVRLLSGNKVSMTVIFVNPLGLLPGSLKE